MNQQEKLGALVQKAIDGGWEWRYNPFVAYDATKKTAAHSIVTNKDEFWITIFGGTSVESLIFNHDFSKALFGKRRKEWLGGYYWSNPYEIETESFANVEELLNSWVFQGGEPKPSKAELEAIGEDGFAVKPGNIYKQFVVTNMGFKHYLKQAVISDDPISYYYEQVFNGGKYGRL